MAKRRIKTIEPWTFVPANYNERGNYPAGAGDYSGQAIKAKVGTDRVSSMISKPKDITSGFKKPITQA